MDPEEIDMAVGGKKSDQDDQTATSQRHEADAIQNRQRINAGCSNKLLIGCCHGSDRKPAEGALLVQVYHYRACMTALSAAGAHRDEGD